MLLILRISQGEGNKNERTNSKNRKNDISD